MGTVESLKLEEWTERNAGERVPILNDPRVYRFLSPFLPLPYTEAHSMEFLHACKADGMYEYALAAGGKIVGSIGGNVVPEQGGGVFELGYYLAPSHWRRGLMSRAIPLFLEKLAAAEPGLVRVRAKVFDFNTASMALLEHCGFIHRPCGELLRARDGLEHKLNLYETNVPGESARHVVITA